MQWSHQNLLNYQTVTLKLKFNFQTWNVNSTDVFHQFSIFTLFIFPWHNVLYKQLIGHRKLQEFKLVLEQFILMKISHKLFIASLHNKSYHFSWESLYHFWLKLKLIYSITDTLNNSVAEWLDDCKFSVKLWTQHACWIWFLSALFKIVYSKYAESEVSSLDSNVANFCKKLMCTCMCGVFELTKTKMRNLFLKIINR